MFFPRHRTKFLSRAAPKARSGSKSLDSRLPRNLKGFLAFIMALTLMPWLLAGITIFGFDVTGWTWVAAAAGAMFFCLGAFKRVAFPLKLWSPWIILLCSYWYIGRYYNSSPQTFFQMLTPIAVGCAASTFRPGKMQLANVVRWIGKLPWIVWGLILVKMPLILLGQLPGFGTMAAESIGSYFLQPVTELFMHVGTNSTCAITCPCWLSPWSPLLAVRWSPCSP